MADNMAGNASGNKQPAEKVFHLRDCALIAIATGKSAMTLPDLHSHMLSINQDSLYYHFWGGLLQPRFEEREYNNDFAAWVRHGLHDMPLAERLAVVDPTELDDLEDLRQVLLELIEQRLDESEFLQWTRSIMPFEFIRSQIVVFNPHQEITSPEQLAESIPNISASSVFYHFVDARRRLPERTDDFRFWLSAYGDQYADLSEQLASVDPYFESLIGLRTQLAEIFQNHFKGSAS
jgi:hypothetical protein